MADNEKNLATDRIKELEAQVQAIEATHTAQAKRGDDLDAALREMQDKHDFQRKRADKAETALKKATQDALKGSYAVLDGKTYPIVGSFRADSTFVEVKRGHCEEGLTLLAIQKVF